VVTATATVSEPIDRAAVVAGVYAWTVTVALPLSHPLAPGTARGAAALALAALVAGTVLRRRRPALGRALGVWGLLAFSVLAWALGRALLLGYRLDPVLGALGSVGWAAYGMTWAASFRLRAPAVEAGGQNDAPGPTAPVRKPRSRLSRSAHAVALAGCSLASALLLFAWWIPDRARGVVGHAVALAGAAWVAVLSFQVAGLAAAPPPADRRSADNRLRRALLRARWPLTVAVALAALGAALTWLR
jgi:hypothetical protein